MTDDKLIEWFLEETFGPVKYYEYFGLTYYEQLNYEAIYYKDQEYIIDPITDNDRYGYWSHVLKQFMDEDIRIKMLKLLVERI
jgi:hypothetical protein